MGLECMMWQCSLQEMLVKTDHPLGRTGLEMPASTDTTVEAAEALIASGINVFLYPLKKEEMPEMFAPRIYIAHVFNAQTHYLRQPWRAVEEESLIV